MKNTRSKFITLKSTKINFVSSNSDLKYFIRCTDLSRSPRIL